MATKTTETKGEGATVDLAASQFFATVFQAYLECGDEVQAAVREMVEICNDPNATGEEKHSALLTIDEALFPSRHHGILGVDLEDAEKDAPISLRRVLAQADSEEAAFSQRLAAAMEAKGMTQSELAEATGVGQPAISMMLARNCRPQRRTVEKLAGALGVAPSDLWPSMGESG